MVRTLLKLFIFFAPFTSFFALSAWLRIPIILNLALIIGLVVSLLCTPKKVKLNFIKYEDLALFTFFILVWISFLFGFLEKRSFNHTLAYTNAIVFIFFFTKLSMHYVNINSLEISKIIYRSFLLITTIIIVDFIGVNYFNFELRKLFSEADGVISNMDYYIRNGFLRVGGVSEEPGHMAHFYNIYFGISLYYIFKTKNKIPILLVVFFLFAHFCMLSNAGIALVFIGLFLVFSINRLATLTISKTQLFLGFGTTLFMVISLTILFVFDLGGSKQLLTDFFNKLLFNETDKAVTSSGQRIYQWSRAFSNFIKHPVLGSGPGFGVDQDSEGYLSVYLTILADLGVLAFLFFLIFISKIVKKAMCLPIKFRGFLLFSMLTSVLHLIIIAEFYHAPFWILCMFIQLCYQEHKKVAL